MMVIPVYIYNNEELHDLVIFGELLAVAAILMCLAFVTVDLAGRPFLALDSRAGPIEFPGVDAELGCDRLERLFAPERPHLRLPPLLPVPGQETVQVVYIPFVFVAIGWAVSIHTVTASCMSAWVGVRSGIPRLSVHGFWRRPLPPALP